MENCAVCGMEVEISGATQSTIYNDKPYYFCTTLCNVIFQQNTEKYVVRNYDKKNDK